MIAGIQHDHAGNGKLTPPTPGDIARALTGRDYLSWSQISTFQACSLKWHFAYVQQAKPERVSAALLLGASVHAAIQHVLEAQLAAEKQPTVEELMAVFQRTWIEQAGDTPVEYGRDDSAETQADTARRILEAFMASPYARPIGQTIGVEESLRVSLAHDLPDLLAKIDHLSAVDGHLVVTDFKTARSMWGREAAAEHGEQLELYAQAAKQIAEDLGLHVKLRFVILTKAKAPKVDEVAVESSPGRVSRSRLIIRNVFNAMQTGLIYPSPSTMNCSGCPFKHRCDRWHAEDHP